MYLYFVLNKKAVSHLREKTIFFLELIFAASRGRNDVLRIFLRSLIGKEIK